MPVIVNKEEADKLQQCGKDPASDPDKATGGKNPCTTKTNSKKAVKKTIAAAFYSGDGKKKIQGLKEEGPVVIKFEKKNVNNVFVEIANSADFIFSLEKDGQPIKLSDFISVDGAKPFTVFAKFKN
ncbi:MAG TPA: hypothetical protein PL009_10405 [Flavipsychrobacter sp.]|nr:hypothetical protein [Flavipsychrobacter sp.]